MPRAFIPRYLAVLFGCMAVFTAGTSWALPGDPDATFGSNGIAAVEWGSGADTATQAVRDANGRYVVLVGSADGTQRLFRINANGSRDTNFGVNGLRSTGLPADTVNTSINMSIDNTGRIIVAGVFGPAGARHFGVTRLLDMGMPDPSFGNAGFSSEGPLPLDSQQVAIAVDVNNRIALASTSPTNYLLMLTPSGLGDVNFGTNGVVSLMLNSPAGGPIHGMRFDSALRLLLTGTTLNNWVIARLTTAGALDGTFGNGGQRFHKIGNFDSVGLRILTDSSGRILVAGTADDNISLATLCVGRFLTDGTLDTSFGAGGLRCLPHGANYGFHTGSGFALDSLERIVVGSSAGRYNSQRQCGIFRLTDTGSLDPSFDGDGVRWLTFGSQVGDTCGPAMVSPDDSIAIAGSVGNYSAGSVQDGNPNVGLARVTSSGISDAGFGMGGTVAFDLSNRGAGVNAVAALPGGKVLVAGYSYNFQGLFQNAVIARVLSNGTLDPSFGSGGKLVIPPGSVSDVNTMTTDPAGNVIVGLGSAVPPQPSQCTNCRATVARFNHEGLFDTSFGVGGFYTSDVGTYTRAIARDSRGYIYVAAEQHTTGPGGTLDTRRIRVERLFPNGNRDAGYSGSGVVFLPFDQPLFPAAARASAIAIDASDRVIIAAGRSSGTATNSPFIWRLDPEGAVDTTFGTNGVTYAFEASGSRISEITGLAIDASHRIIATGPAEGQFQALRLTASGQYDNTFGSGGFVRIDPSGAIDEARSVVTAGDKVLLGGSISSGGRYVYGIVSLNADGTPDNDFGPGGARSYPLSPGNDLGIAMTKALDGRLVLAGDSANVFGLLRVQGVAVPPPVIAEDFNADGRPDILWRHAPSGALYVWYMNGVSLVSDQLITSVDPVWKLDGIADFNGDGHPDIVWRNGAGNTYVWYLVNGVFQSDAFLFSLPPEWVIQGVADFNTDGKPDFLLRNTSSGNAFVWFFNNNVAIGDQFLFNIDPSWKVEGVGDFNLDDQPDLLFRNVNSGLAFAWRSQFSGGNLTLTTSSPPIFSIDSSWEVVQIADWNADGKPDLLFRNKDTGVVFVWYMDGTTLTTSEVVNQIDPVWEIVPRR